MPPLARSVSTTWLSSVRGTRLRFRHPTPLISIQLAPPAVCAMAWLALFPGRLEPWILMLWGYGLFQLLLGLRLGSWLRAQPFVPAYWAYTFGVDATASHLEARAFWCRIGSSAGASRVHRHQSIDRISRHMHASPVRRRPGFAAPRRVKLNQTDQPDARSQYAPVERTFSRAFVFDSAQSPHR